MGGLQSAWRESVSCSMNDGPSMNKKIRNFWLVLLLVGSAVVVGLNRDLLGEEKSTEFPRQEIQKEVNRRPSKVQQIISKPPPSADLLGAPQALKASVPGGSSLGARIERLIKSNGKDDLMSVLKLLSGCISDGEMAVGVDSDKATEDSFEEDSDFCGDLTQNQLSRRFQIADYLQSIGVSGTAVYILSEGPGRGLDTSFWEGDSQPQWKREVVGYLVKDANLGDLPALMSLIELYKYPSANISKDDVTRFRALALDVLKSRARSDTPGHEMQQKLEVMLRKKHEY